MTPRKIAAALGALALGLAPALSFGQDETPAIPDDQPAVETSVPERRAPGAPAAPATVQQAPVGTTVIGESESPIGLYIMPWRQSEATTGLERPARLLDEALLPLDPEVFRRQVEYHRALSEHLERTGRATP